jgi:hypothetical protein
MEKSTLQILNAGNMGERLDALSALLSKETEPPVRRPQFSNNHIHTFYSFSPYSPAAAVYFAREAGLETAGIMDHDSLAGAREFLSACEMAGVAATVGMEFRVSFLETRLRAGASTIRNRSGTPLWCFTVFRMQSWTLYSRRLLRFVKDATQETGKF